MKNSINLIFLLALVLSALACQSTTNGGKNDPQGASEFDGRAPKWVKTGKVPGYPVRDFICGLGYSPNALPELDALDQAKLEAFTDISTQVETHISAEFTSIQKTVVHNEDEQNFVDLTNVAKQVTKEVFGGIQVVERYYDKKTGTACVFAVMNRVKFGKRLLKEAEDANIKIQGFLKAYEEAAQDPSAALKNLVHAHKSMEIIVRSHIKMLGVGATSAMLRQMEELNNPTLAARLTTEVSKVRDSVRIEPVSGNEQKAKLTGELKDPVKVRVFRHMNGKDIPLTSFPIHVKVKDAETAVAVPHGEATDEKGCFSFGLSELKATGSASNIVDVALNFEAIEKGSALSPPTFGVSYFLPTKENTKVGVVIYETIDNQENRNPNTGSIIKKALSDIGFHVIRVESNAKAKDIVNMSQKDLEEQFAKQCDYIIVGTAEAEKSDDPTGSFGFIFYRTRLVIDALELGTGKTIHFEVPMDQNTKAGMNSKNKAIRASLTKAAKVMVGDVKAKRPGLLAQKFIARFESGAEWEE